MVARVHLQVNRLKGQLRTAIRSKKPQVQIAQLEHAVATAQDSRDAEAKHVSTELVNDSDSQLQAAITNCAFLQGRFLELPQRYRRLVPYADMVDVYEMMRMQWVELLAAMAEVSTQSGECVQPETALDFCDQQLISDRVADLLGTGNEKDERLERSAFRTLAACQWKGLAF
jgi:hypothetical protein